MSALTVRFHRGGVHLPNLGLWLDSRERQSGPERVFVSHAHTDHIGSHREVVLTDATARLMRSRLSGRRSEIILPFREARKFDGGRTSYGLTLLPAGHILGSAMAHIEASDASLLYTGDFKLRRGFAAEPCAPRRADILVMETTFGRPQYQFPPAEAVMREVIQFCQQALDDGVTPLLLSYSLGKAQELLSGLAGAGLPIMLHESAQKLARIYEQFGQRFPAYERFDAETARGKVLICPPQAARENFLGHVGKTRSAVVTGWAMETGCRYRYQVDAAFPLSDHADFHELVEMAKRVAPRKVYTLHGFAADFAQTLRDLGFDAQALSEADQLHLPLTRAVV